MSEEYKPSSTKNSYIPHILPEWENTCIVDGPVQNKSKIIQLTNENAGNYAEISSHVGWKKRVNYALKSFKNTEEADDSILTSLLENVISTVIVVASDESLPDEYLLNSYLYLRNIHNEFGENPPNISAFLELLKSRAAKNILSILESIDNSDMQDFPPNLTITRIPKDLQ